MIHYTFCISSLIFVYYSWKTTLSLLSSSPESVILHLQCLLNSTTRAICLKQKPHHIHHSSPIIFSSHFIQNKNQCLKLSVSWMWFLFFIILPKPTLFLLHWSLCCFIHTSSILLTYHIRTCSCFWVKCSNPKRHLACFLIHFKN